MASLSLIWKGFGKLLKRPCFKTKDLTFERQIYLQKLLIETLRERLGKCY